MISRRSVLLGIGGLVSAAFAARAKAHAWVEKKKIVTRGAAGRATAKTVTLEASYAIGDPMAIATRALAAAAAGAKVLVVRNTVGDAVAVAKALMAADPDHPALFRVNRAATLHHGRFAREDRVLLDRAVEAALGRKPGSCGELSVRRL